mgnify:CR=1 FL=1
MSTSVIIHEVEYPAEISGVLQNPKWDRRDTKAITLEMTHAQAVSLFVDGLAWGIKQVNTYPVFDDKGQPTGGTTTETQTFDNSDYSVAGSITDNRDGTVTVMMGKHTELEIAQDARDEAESALAELEAAYDNG